MLSDYIYIIRKEDIISRLNDVLQSDASSGGAAADIRSYYASRPELRNYTLGVELDRDLDYTLILEDGRSLTDKAGIRAHFGYDKNGAKPDQSQGNGTVSKRELLIRAANQSLLADAFVALTGSEDVLQPCMQKEENRIGLILPGPILSMASVVERCHFMVDLQTEKVEAICVIAISVPVEDRRLVLARAILVANFQPGEKKKRQQLVYDMKLVKAHHFPQSRTLRNASISLAKDQENLLRQNNSHDESTIKKTNELQRSFSLFR